MSLFRHDVHALAGAYALDAIEDPAELSRFTDHLSRCTSCAAEVRGFREVATAMGFAAAAAPPAGLRDRVLTASQRTRQLPPEVARHNHARPRGAPAGRGARPQRSASPARRSGRTWIPALSGLVAAAGIAAAVVFGIGQAHTEHQLQVARAQNQAISAILTSPGSKIVAAKTTLGGQATVVLSADRGQLVVYTTGLPAPPSGKVYQLWLIGPGPKQFTSAGLLPAATAGKTPAVLASGLVAGDKLGMTVEPAGGSAQPTTTPILAVALLARVRPG